MNWRLPVVLAALALLAWIGVEIGRAGSDIAVQRTLGTSTLNKGRAMGRRIDNRSWSLDYDSITMSPDGTQITIAHVRDGRIHRPGKPDVLIKADGVTTNQVTNDLYITGPVHVTENLGPGRTRTFDSVGARYSGVTRELALDHTATMTEGDAKVVIAKATVNFRTGEVDLGPIEGTKPGGSIP